MFAAEGRAVTNVEGTGSYQILDKQPETAGGKTYNSFPQFSSNQTYDITVKDSNLKEGDYIPIEISGLGFLGDDVKIGDKVVGKLQQVGPTDEGRPKSGNWNATEENINDTQNRIYTKSNWKSSSNKNIEGNGKSKN